MYNYDLKLEISQILLSLSPFKIWVLEIKLKFPTWAKCAHRVTWEGRGKYEIGRQMQMDLTKQKMAI